MVDLDKKRLAVAKGFGANSLVNGSDGHAAHHVMELTEGAGVDVAIEAVGLPDTFDICQAIVAAGGRIANANRRRETALARCRQLLGAVACADRPEPTNQLRCPACSGTMLVIERMTSAQLHSRLDLILPTLQRCYVDSS